MRRYLMGSLGTIVLIASAVSLHAQAPTDDPGVELAFMPRTMTVTLLNEGGKYVAIDLKHIPQGGACRMDKDATIARVGPGATPGTTRVRYAAAQAWSVPLDLSCALLFSEPQEAGAWQLPSRSAGA